MSIAPVQHKNTPADGTTSTSVSVVLTSAVGSGHAVMGYVSYGDGSVGISSVTDDKSNTYTVVDQIADSPNAQQYASFYLLNVTNAPQTITVNFTGPFAFRAICVDEFSGIATTLALDGHTGQVQTGVGTGTNAATSGNTTTTAAGDLIYGMIGDDSNLTNLIAPGTGFLRLNSYDGAGNGLPMATEWALQGSASSATAATFTSAVGSSTLITMVMAFKAAAAAAPPWLPMTNDPMPSFERKNVTI